MGVGPRRKAATPMKGRISPVVLWSSDPAKRGDAWDTLEVRGGWRTYAVQYNPILLSTPAGVGLVRACLGLEAGCGAREDGASAI